MDKKGMLTTCDYPGCEETVFRETIGDDEADGGFTRWNKFEPYPEGWGFADGKRLCPKHYSERTRIVEKFYERGVVKSE